MTKGKYYYAMIFVTFIFCFFVMGTFQRQDISELEKVTYTVRCGDTLWDIAKEQKPDSIPMLEYMQAIYKENKTDGNIYPGQQLIFLKQKENRHK